MPVVIVVSPCLPLMILDIVDCPSHLVAMKTVESRVVFVDVYLLLSRQGSAVIKVVCIEISIRFCGF